MSTLYITRDGDMTVYFYGSVMVIHHDIGLLDEEFRTHQVKDEKHKEENNRILWEKW